MITVRKMAARAVNNRNEIQNKDSEATIYLYGDIGGYYGVDHEEWVQEFNAIDADVIHLRIDSDGGDVFAARAMKTAIMQHKAKVIAHIDGLAASAASFLAMGADEIEIVDGGFIMIHNAASFIDIFGYFNAKDMQDVIDDITKEMNLHEKINDSIAADYAKGGNKTKEEYAALMGAETWFTAQEAVDAGLAHKIYDGQPVEGSYDLSTYRNTPQAVKDRNKKFSKRTLEKTLRDAGLSKKEAKAIISEGFNDDQRDVDQADDSQADGDAQRDADVSDTADVLTDTPADETTTDDDQRDADILPEGKAVNALLIKCAQIINT